MQRHDVLDRVQQFIQTEQLFQSQDRILVAISGGPDSVLLAFILKELGYSVGLAHMNYHLRGTDSVAEEALVRQYAEAWNLPVFVQVSDTKAHAAVHKLSFQDAARRLRYRFFERVMEEEQYDYCATGHHGNDQVESILMSFFRGHSTEVLKGIPVRRERYVRPLLCLNKTEILQGLAHFELDYGEDKSNEESVYLRNQFRNQLIPALHQINPSIGEQIHERYRLYQLQYQFISQLIQPYLEKALSQENESTRLNWQAFLDAFGADMLDLLILAAGSQWGFHGKMLFRLLELINSQTGKLIEGEEGTVFRVENGLLYEPYSAVFLTEPISIDTVDTAQEHTWQDQSVSLEWEAKGDFQFGPDVFYLDEKTLQWPLKLRHWQKGDKMQPFGMRGEKKLSDIFINQKYSAQQKAKALVIEDQKGIVALSGYRIAERVKVQADTAKALKIVIQSQN